MAITYFVSFVGEAVMNRDFADYIAGRTEVTPSVSVTGYPTEEIRWLTKRVDEFEAFRDKWDFKDVNQKTLDMIRDTTARKFCDRVE
jgi:hypothetical protein